MSNREELRNKFFEILKTESAGEIRRRFKTLGKGQYMFIDSTPISCPMDLGLDSKKDNYGNCAYCGQCWENTIKHYQDIGNEVNTENYKNRLLEDLCKAYLAAIPSICMLYEQDSVSHADLMSRAKQYLDGRK